MIEEDVHVRSHSVLRSRQQRERRGKSQGSAGVTAYPQKRTGIRDVLLAEHWSGRGRFAKRISGQGGTEESVRSVASFTKQHLANVVTKPPEIIQARLTSTVGAT
jgi:hypothetical protein